MSRLVEDALDDTPAPGQRVVVDNSALIVSFFTSFFALYMLYNVTSQALLWLVVVLVIDLIVMQLKRMVSRRLYSRMEADDVDQQGAMQFFRFIHLILIFVATRLVIDIALVAVYSSDLQWYQWLHLLLVVIFMAIVIYSVLIPTYSRPS